jgi:hypothetical protein
MDRTDGDGGCTFLLRFGEGDTSKVSGESATVIGCRCRSRDPFCLVTGLPARDPCLICVAVLWRRSVAQNCGATPVALIFGRRF